jgi:hypothetical protein
MSQPLPPWSLHWTSNGELSPMDRADLAALFLGFHLPERRPFGQELGHPVTASGASHTRRPRIYDFPTAKP